MRGKDEKDPLFCCAAMRRVGKEKNITMKYEREILIIIGILFLCVALFAACGKSRSENEVQPIPFPEGVTLTGLYMTQQGMYQGPYYILKTTDAGTYMKISLTDPAALLQEDKTEKEQDNSEYFAFANTVKDCEYASLVLLQEDTPLRQLEDAIASAGALGWDGYHESKSMPYVEDSGDRYELYLELSNGETVTMWGYNCRPMGFSDLLGQVRCIFDANSDYSRYYIKNFDESPCDSMYVCFQRGMTRGEWRLELNRSHGQWVVVLQDPFGIFLEEGTDISEYQNNVQALPYDRFLNIFKKYNAQIWNGIDAPDTSSQFEDSYDIKLYFQNGKEFTMKGKVPPDGFEEFKKECVAEMAAFYSEVKNKQEK